MNSCMETYLSLEINNELQACFFTDWKILFSKYEMKRALERKKMVWLPTWENITPKNNMLKTCLWFRVLILLYRQLENFYYCFDRRKTWIRYYKRTCLILHVFIFDIRELNT